MIEEKSELHNSGPQLKHHMRILRKKFGASSKIGRRASNMEGAIDCLSNPDRDYGEHQRVNLGASIRRQLTDIARLADQPSKLPLQHRVTQKDQKWQR